MHIISKKSVKSSVSLFLAAVLMTSSLVVLNPNKAQAQSQETQETQTITNQIDVVALGDSIARAYGCKRKDSYSNLLANYIRETLAPKNYTVNYANHGVDGYIASEVYSLVYFEEDIQQKVKDAEIITLSVGGNEFMRLLMAEGMKVTNVSPSSPDVLGDIFKVLGTPEGSKLIAHFSSDEFKKALTQTVAGYLKSATNLVNYITELNPNAKIILTTIPEPTKNPLFSSFVGGIMGEFNKVILSKLNCADNKNLQIVDCDKAFREIQNPESPLTFMKIDQTDISKSVIDPHPTPYGHQVMAKEHIKAIESYINDILSKQDFILGDISADGKLTAVDALLILRHISNSSLIPQEKLFLADFNKDNKVNTVDVLNILRKIATN